MIENDSSEVAVEGLQQLGLKKYEAEVFVGLSRIGIGTAKDISEVTDVPRTRVYDSIRVLKADGMVEVQHSSPKRFRAVPVDEATKTLRNRYDSEIEKIETVLKNIDRVEPNDKSSQEVWSLSNSKSIDSRTDQLMEAATEEVVLVIGHESVLTDSILDSLNKVGDNVDLFVGAMSEEIRKKVESRVHSARTFDSDLGWLQDRGPVEEGVSVGRLLLTDRATTLVSSVDSETMEEKAVVGEGFENGIVVIARRIMTDGLAPEQRVT